MLYLKGIVNTLSSVDTQILATECAEVKGDLHAYFNAVNFSPRATVALVQTADSFGLLMGKVRINLSHRMDLEPKPLSLVASTAHPFELSLVDTSDGRFVSLRFAESG